MNMRTFAFIAFFSLMLITGASSAFAQSNTGNYGGGVNTGIKLVNPLGKDTTVNSFLLSILDIVTDTIGPVIVILMLVYVGFLFVTAQGNSTKISAAREALLWTVVGALILLGAKAIAIGIKATVEALSSGG